MTEKPHLNTIPTNGLAEHTLRNSITGFKKAFPTDELNTIQVWTGMIVQHLINSYNHDTANGDTTWLPGLVCNARLQDDLCVPVFSTPDASGLPTISCQKQKYLCVKYKHPSSAMPQVHSKVADDADIWRDSCY